MARRRITSAENYTVSNPRGEIITSSNGGSKTVSADGTVIGTATARCEISIEQGEIITFTGGGTLSIDTTPNKSNQ